MGWAEIQRDLQRNARVWEAVTGTRMAPLFRPPYGYRNATTDLAAARAGFPNVVLWDIDPKDTIKRFTDGQLIHNASMGRAGSIVLLHIGPDATPRILARVIASYRARGFTFVTVPELLSPAVPAPHPTPTPPVPSTASAATSPYVGAWHANFSGAHWTFTLAPSGGGLHLPKRSPQGTPHRPVRSVVPLHGLMRPARTRAGRSRPAATGCRSTARGSSSPPSSTSALGERPLW